VADFDPVGLLSILHNHGVRFVVVGGIAARLHGAPLVTEDVDVTPDRSQRNLVALSATLVDLDARLRTVAEPEGVPFPIDPDMLASASSWALTTTHGDLDIMFEPAGTRGYADLAADASAIRISTDPILEVPVASLRDVIRSKEAAGRDKDRAALPLLRRTLEERDRHITP